MSILAASVPLYTSPSTRKALGELATLLRDYRYSEHAVGRIVAYAAREGTPTGCPELDREDEADASMVFVDELEPVPFDSPAWGRREDVLFDARMLAEGSHPWPVPTVGDDDRTGPDDADTAEFPTLAALGIAPVAGGAPGPDAADYADYVQWAAELDARRDQEQFYAAHPLAEFNAIRTD